MQSRLLNIVEFTREEFSGRLQILGIEKYRAGQIFEWIYKKRVYEFGGMTNLSEELIDKLSQNYCVDLGEVVKKSKSKADKSSKILLKNSDGAFVEAVSIPSKQRRTVCVSTQSGCKFGCAFCASGKFGFKRNLTPGEMITQVLRGRDELDTPVTNLVFMGIGEPFDNYDNLIRAIRMLNSPSQLGIGARKITVSTCGVVPKIKKFIDEGLQIELSISLHAANDTLRSQIMPVNRKYKIAELISTCSEYTEKTKREITYEYLLVDNLNCSKQDARDLAKLLKKARCFVNLIPLNPINDFPYETPSKDTINAFERILINSGIRTTIRHSTGKDINASCGQLRINP
jgi:23S rRNA (adenine2503-C2)-methyltransferase